MMKKLFFIMAVVFFVVPVVSIHAAAEEDAKESEEAFQEQLTPAQKRERLTDEGKNELDEMLVSIYKRYKACHQEEGRIKLFNEEGRIKLFNDMKHVLENGADSNVSTRAFYRADASVLQDACQTGLIKIIDLLITYNCIDGARDENGNGYTPLMHASYNNQLGVVKQLLSNKASVDICMKDGQDALTNALDCPIGGDCESTKIIKMLVFAGASYSSYSKWMNCIYSGKYDEENKIYDDREEEEGKIYDDRGPVIKEVQQVREGLGGRDGQNWSIDRLRESGVLALFVPVRVLEKLILDLTDHHTGDPFIDNLIDELLEQRAVETSQKEDARCAHVSIVEVPKEKEKVLVRVVSPVETDEEHKEDGERQDGIECPECTFINGITQQFCSICGKVFENEPHFYDV